MSRIPKANRESLSADQQKIWDHIHAARKGGARRCFLRLGIAHATLIG